MPTWAWVLIATVGAAVLGWLGWRLSTRAAAAGALEVPAVPPLKEHPGPAELEHRKAAEAEIVADAAAEDDPGNALFDLPRRDL